MELIKVIKSGKLYEAMLDERFIGTLEFENWFTNKAKFYLGKEELVYNPLNFFQTKFVLKNKDGTVLEESTASDGNIILRFNERKYIFRHKGIFNYNYFLYDESGTLLFTIKNVFSWKRWRSEYHINCKEAFSNSREDIILILLCVYHHLLDQQGAG